MSTFDSTRLRRLRHFPMCTGFVIFNLCRSLAILGWYHLGLSQSYLHQHYAIGMIEIVLACFVFHELNRYVFRQYPGLRQLGVVLFRWLATMIVLVSAVGAASTPGDDAERIWTGIALFYQCGVIGMGGLLLFLFFFAAYFGMTWRHYLSGIAMGVASFAGVALVERVMFSHFGPLVAYLSPWRSVILDSAVMVWLVFLTSPRRDTLPARRQAAHYMETWNSRLQEFLAR